MAPPKTLYKYRAFNVLSLSSIVENNLYFSHPGEFNDPLDCSPTVHCDSGIEDLRALLSFFINQRVSSEIMDGIYKAKVNIPDSIAHAVSIAERQAKKETTYLSYMATNPFIKGTKEQIEINYLVNAIEIELNQWFESGVFCLSQIYDSPLLWSHYGDQHKGFCIGYQVESHSAVYPEPVQYGGNRRVKTSTLCAAYLETKSYALDQVKREVLMRKASGWDYEGEWRIIGEQGLQESPLIITQITFGLRCPRPVKHAVITAMHRKGRKLKFYEIFSDKKTFKLRRRKVDIDELQAGLPVVPVEFIDLMGHESS